ncbi:GAG-pre-integrase domain [Fragilaria crotonensis]|nr:GAG-pre-integrase domain [Fragilaria crotonensis]
MTAPNTPQMNGVVERSFATCKDRAFATMYCAWFTLESQGLLWPEAINTMTKLGNALPRPGTALDPYTAWFGANAVPKIIDFLQPFGRIAYVTDRSKVKAKSDVRASKCVFVGYANDHSGDTYKFYNPATKHTILSRDVHQWMEWHGRITALDDMALFNEIDRIKTDSIILPASPDVQLLPEDDVLDADDLWDLPALVPASTEDPVVQPVVLRPARRNLAPEYGSGAVTRARARASTVTFADGPRNDDNTVAIATCTSTTEAEVIFNAQLQSDPQPGVPKNFKDLLKLNDPKWTTSMHAELENFLKCDAWEFIPRNKLPKNRKTLRCRWIFKLKLDGTRKSRSMIRGYEQEPGVEYVESYSPLATNTTIKVVLAVTLEQEEKHDDWIQILVDVEAAFLNALVDSDVYIEFPEGLLEYLESKGIYLADHIIKLKQARYGLVQSPRLWMMTFAKILINLGLTQCKTDPCLFTLHDPDGNLLLLVVVYCDDSIITGIRKHVDRIKKGISDAVAVSDLGNLVRHLGVDYETGRDQTGKYIRSSMTDYLQAIVRDFENDMELKLKEQKTPGAAVTSPLRSTEEDEIVMQELYRSYVGRLMFACGKTEPTLSNAACRELTCHLNAPNDKHWNALRHLIGYSKSDQFQGVKMRAPK